MAIKTGVLVHSRHIETTNWEELVWGVPSQDKLGDLPRLVELLLHETSNKPIACIVTGSTETRVNGLYDGEYTKQYWLDHFDRLNEFPRLKVLLDGLSSEEHVRLRRRLQDVIVTKPLKNTADEIAHSAEIFSKHGITEVVQVTSASHGPRCIQLQADARLHDRIPATQMWFLLVSDMCFDGLTPKDTMIIESPHRGDDPMLSFEPTLVEALKPYFYELPPADKKKLNLTIAAFIAKHKL